jgi:protein-S-isoprenylcysteine O-methyltransferase Ste14
MRYVRVLGFRASDFEFRNRFWLIGGIFGVAFFCYTIDHVNAAEALAGLLGNVRGARAVLAVGAGLTVLAALVRSWAASYLRGAVVHDTAIHAEKLVADGPYRRVRNPLYFGNILLALGMGLLASRTGYAIIVVGMTAFCLRLILREEAELRRSQGESYRQYCAAVPRLVPALRARVPAGGGAPHWLDGFASESFIWGFVLGMAAFAATLNQVWLWILVAAGFAARFAHDAYRKRRRA